MAGRVRGWLQLAAVLVSALRDDVHLHLKLTLLGPLQHRSGQRERRIVTLDSIAILSSLFLAIRDVGGDGHREEEVGPRCI